MSANLFSRQTYNDLVPFTVCVSSGSYHQRAEMQYSKLHLCFSCKVHTEAAESNTVAAQHRKPVWRNTMRACGHNFEDKALIWFAQTVRTAGFIYHRIPCKHVWERFCATKAQASPQHTAGELSMFLGKQRLVHIPTAHKVQGNLQIRLTYKL